MPNELWTTLNVGTFHTIAAAICQELQRRPSTRMTLLRTVAADVGVRPAEVGEVFGDLVVPYSWWPYRHIRIQGDPYRDVLRLHVEPGADPVLWFRTAAGLYRAFEQQKTLTAKQIAQLLARTDLDWQIVLRELVRECGSPQAKTYIKGGSISLVPEWRLTEDGLLLPFGMSR